MNENIEGVIGIFASADELPPAIECARAAYFTASDLEVYMPVGDPVAVDALRPGTSPIRWLALVGALVGLAIGMGITTGLSLDYPLVVGGKPVVALPPFFVTAFELMALFAATGAMVGFIWFAGLLHLAPSSAYRQAFLVDQFALLIRCLPGEGPRVRAEQALRDAGALEVYPVTHEEHGVLAEVP